MTPNIVPMKTIASWRPCAGTLPALRKLYPDGIPLTLEAALNLHDKGFGVMWGLTHLLDTQQRRDLILFTLRQRQPHLVSILRKAALADQAEAIAALSFDKPENARAATPTLAAAGAAAWHESIP